MRSVGIVALSVAAAVCYGLIHDQITVRVCLEYFTIGHPPVFPTTSPTLLAVGWGIIATWWAGFSLGVPLAIAARAGSRQPRPTRSLLRPILILLLIMSVCAAVAGLCGFLLADRGVIVLNEPLATQIPRDRHARFLADLCA